MKVICRDLGIVDYKECWDLQQELFDTMLARKSTARAGTGLVPDTKSAGEDVLAGDAEKGENTGSDLVLGTKNAGEDVPAGDAEKGENAGSGSVPSTKNPAGGYSGEGGTILLVEHPPVYTLGKSGHTENLLIAREALEAMGAQFFHIDRGGDITFHGPGQLVCYPILDLERVGIGLREYIDALEEAVIRTVRRYGIAAGRIAGASGVWVEPAGRRPRKICAIGVRSSRYVTMHGFALNVTTDLGWFTRINPCGFTDRGVTSIASETGSNPPMQEVKRTVLVELSTVLRCEIAAAL